MPRDLGRTLVVSVFAAVASGAAENAGGWVGTWISEAAGVTNVTMLTADGRFRTEHLAGLGVRGVTSGRWELRETAVLWTYDTPQAGLPAEDVNPIVRKTRDRFVLRELDGSESTFFLKGVRDPKAPAYLPVAVGAGWVLKDELGEFAIRVSARESVGGHDCYRVDWIQGAVAYQSEYWFADEDGIRVAGKRMLGTKLEFAAPYLLVKRVLTPGDAWKASVTVGGREVGVAISVGQRAEVVTPAGTFQALPVTLESELFDYVRWYAEDVGLVREDSLVAGYVQNTKTLQRRLE